MGSRNRPRQIAQTSPGWLVGFLDLLLSLLHVVDELVKAFGRFVGGPVRLVLRGKLFGREGAVSTLGGPTRFFH